MNCKPGDLARIVVSYAGNEGRRVSVERAATLADILEFDRATDGRGGPDPMRTQFWVVLPLQPLRVIWVGGSSSVAIGRVCYPDSWLMPIGDDGDAPGAKHADGIDMDALSWG